MTILLSNCLAVSREGLPLRKAEHTFYLDQAIHTQMCFSNFSDIIHSIINMDADVIIIENSQFDEKLL
ncbi:hypothetical protein EJB05_38583, partial [Eragrostis curvula]